ncbi:hypothetical protein OSB04_004448 [Centaurea solstitialis]|uniref:Transcription termination factor MTERF2, chloroplastic n=1 Tax=Centaurea solstitialis TaxID=347529 RepID=A0AA38UDG7_9ASTR|nr:hypothetical protein OSB04_004448 [Centaurea solstitialis]
MWIPIAPADMPPSSTLVVFHNNWFMVSHHHHHHHHHHHRLTSPSPSLPFHIQDNRLLLHHHSQRRLLMMITSSSSTPITSTSDEDEDEKHKQAAREAVSEILQENGVSQEESMDIAIKAPNYLEMLMDSVRDLDQLFQSTTSNSNSYKKKVFEMGKQKGDKGLVPLLESMVGLPLPSAIHIARYLSPHTPPPKLLQTVKYLRQILFSDVDGRLPLIARTAHRMMMHLSIQARRGGLNLLGSGDGSSFRFLIESFPRLLLLSVESHMKPMVEFLGYAGVPKGCIRNILLLYPPILFYDIQKDIKPTRQVFTKVYGDDMEFGKLLLKYPWILSTSILKNYEEILTFFYAEKVSVVSIRRAIKGVPVILGCSVGKLKLMVQQLRELGVTEKMLHQVIATSPQLLMQKPRDFCQVVMYLKGLGVEDESVGRMVGRCPEIFMTNIDKTLKKKVEFLFELGVSRKHLPRVIRKYPELFVCDVNNALLPRMMYLLKIGLSKREIAFMVGRFSPLLGYSIEEVLRPKYEFLVKTMQKPLEEVVEYPRYFSYSLEKKIKPRFWAIKSRNCECSLKDMLGKNDEEFAADYMSEPPPSPP